MLLYIYSHLLVCLPVYAYLVSCSVFRIWDLVLGLYCLVILYFLKVSYELNTLPYASERSGPGCSKLTTSLVNETLKFQTLISQICHYFC